MSDLENKKTEETPKKRPYNLREKKEKKAAYRSLIRPELADELYDKILNIIVVQKKYKDPDYSAKDLAKELKTNTRYLSAVVNSRFGMNYSCLLNEYRVKDALHLLTSRDGNRNWRFWRGKMGVNRGIPRRHIQVNPILATQSKLNVR